MPEVLTLPQRIIWDTDLDSDCDDLAATALLLGFVASGEAELIAATIASENLYSASAMRVLLASGGLGDVPIGAYQGSGISGSSSSLYARQIATQFGAANETRADYPDAVSVLRAALAAAPDGSVEIVTGGTLTNIADLLRSQGDAISPLTGIELVALKVSSINSMGGNFVSSTATENNIGLDIDAANYVAANSPVPIYWSGYETGNLGLGSANLAWRARLCFLPDEGGSNGRVLVDGGAICDDRSASD